MSYRLMNPLLNAIFNHPSPSSKVKEAQNALANHSSAYTILAPETSTLEWNVDKDTSLPYRDLCLQDDFILSHIIQVPSNIKSNQRARYFTTMNGKTVTITDNKLRSNGGFPLPRMVEILEEYVFNPGSVSMPLNAQFVVYVIKYPLLGIPLPSKEVSPTISSRYQLAQAVTQRPRRQTENQRFDLDWMLRGFRHLSRHFYGSLSTVLENFDCSGAKDVDELVQLLDNTVDIAIRLFQSGDNGEITEMTHKFELSGEDVANLLHEYVERNISDRLWDRLVELQNDENDELSEAIERIKNVDISQIGLPDVSIDDLARLDALVHQAVRQFDKLADHHGSEWKIDILLSVLKTLGGKTTASPQHHVNADFLVSLLVLVVCRSNVEHIGSEIASIKTFTYKDVESGQLGYALLTFEGVLFHITKETTNLESVSQNNHRLWQCIQENGNVEECIASLQDQNHESWPTVLISKKNGESCLMQAINKCNVGAAKALLQTETIDIDFILEDRMESGTTLLMAAVETEQKEMIDLILDRILSEDERRLEQYLLLEDKFQRTVGHYLFHAPYLIQKIGHLISWTNRDHNGQTPLFGLFRCYDHPKYEQLVESAFKAWHEQGHADVLDHVDDKGNTLLHIVKTTSAMKKVLNCKPDINWPNYKGMTPMMIYSKYSRQDAIDLLSRNPLLDLDRHEARGMTALELAKDTATISKLDDRVTLITRTVFIDNELYFIIKSAIYNDPTTTVTTVKRTFADFVFLQKWLTYENPYSWIPALETPRNPFAVPFKPSRQVIHEVQTRLNALIRILASHPTFARHELLWEFLLIQDFSKDQSRERCKRKLESEKEMQYNDLTLYNKGDLDLVRTFFEHAVQETTKVSDTLYKLSMSVLRLKSKFYDLASAHKIFSDKMKELEFFSDHFDSPYYKLTNSVQGRSLLVLGHNMAHMALTANSVVAALSQPLHLVDQLSEQETSIQKVQTSLEKLHNKSTWPMGMFEEKRERDVKDAQDRIYIGQNDIRKLSSDIKYAHIVSASELGGFYLVQEEEIKRALRDYTACQVRNGHERLMRLERLLQNISTKKEPRKSL